MYYYPHHKVARSSTPIPQDAVFEVSASTVVEWDYAFVSGRACLVTMVVRLGQSFSSKFWLVGMDLTTGCERTQTFEGEALVRISQLPLGVFVPPGFLKSMPTIIMAAALCEGYYMVIKNSPCGISHVDRPARPCPEVCLKCMKVVGRDQFTGKKKKMEPSMKTLIGVGRHGIDTGGQEWL